MIRWVNHVFARLIEAEPDAQPEYQPLDACRPAPSRARLGAPARRRPSTPTSAEQRANAEELRWREAASAADAVATALHERWLVGDGDTDELRECRPGDITILLPARTSLAALESALVARDIPYRAENSSVVYTTTDIRHVMLALRAADDRHRRVGAGRRPAHRPLRVQRRRALRMARAAAGRGRSAPRPARAARRPSGGGGHRPCALAGRALRHGRTPADLIAALVDERRLVDAVLDSPDARDVWRRIRYVIEQARAWSDAGGHGLRRYLAWVRLQAAESRTADTILPEHDHDAVRIMTIHAAKGLEFPITIVTGLTTVPGGHASAQRRLAQGNAGRSPASRATRSTTTSSRSTSR